uniref:E3 ubiquitin-protein ligase RNF146-A-like n=1 Tax=Myxine glutinosa TaxID=7769 RepID=UPI0035901015
MSYEQEETGGLGGSGSPPGIPDCAVCLQECVHPALLPCGHVFCFLCAKGVALQSRRCALCRRDIPPDFLERPTLLPQSVAGSTSQQQQLQQMQPQAQAHPGTDAGKGSEEAGTANAWFYEGRNGWWQYDERTTGELEEAFSKGWTSLEMLIAGFLYVADLEAMVQYRRNEPTRRRRIKRDLACAPKKGVAGLRLEQATSSSRETSGDGTAAVGVSGVARMQNPVATSASSVPLNQPPTEAVSDSPAVDSRFSGIRLGVGIAGIAGIPGIPAPGIATILRSQALTSSPPAVQSPLTSVPEHTDRHGGGEEEEEEDDDGDDDDYEEEEEEEEDDDDDDVVEQGSNVDESVTGWRGRLVGFRGALWRQSHSTPSTSSSTLPSSVAGDAGNNVDAAGNGSNTERDFPLRLSRAWSRLSPRLPRARPPVPPRIGSTPREGRPDGQFTVTDV